jgi:sialate O-acetylesterase
MIRTLASHLLAFAAVVAISPSPPARAEEKAERPFLHGLFTDHMVLQRGVEAPIWGWTKPGETVTVRLAGKEAEARAGADGKWTVKIGPFAAGGPHTLTVIGPESATRKDVLIGDVWICSGQSNMEWPVEQADDAKGEIARADHPKIRLYTVPKKISYVPESQVKGSWEVCSPQTVGDFSAVGYFFGRDLNRELDVPIGLIDSSWGGTIAEAWVSAESLRAMDDFREAVDQIREYEADRENVEGVAAREVEAWYAKHDPGSAEGKGWADPQLDLASWKAMEAPRKWEGAGLPDFDGVAWFRKEVDLPASWADKDLVFRLGPIDDRDTTWFNGTKVGGKDDFSQPREYKVPGRLTKPGRNVIAIRVLDTGGDGGFVGNPGQMTLSIAGDDQTSPISLAGTWQYRVGTSLKDAGPVPPSVSNNPNVVTVLSNGMIAPLVPFAIKGAIWYQGESNVGRAKQYQTLLPTLIGDWRSRFGVGEFPFFIVQLANFLDRRDEPVDSAWAELREAQWLTTRKVPKSAIASAIDIGEAKDIHPRNKQEVGRRLALDALAIAYGRDVEYSGPEFKSMGVQDGKVRLRFEHVGKGLEAQGDGPLKGFAIAGEDGKFVWADARIDGEAVVVSSPKVEKPRAVRYGWADNPEGNLYNKDGLPATPFRADVKGE